MLVKFVFFQRSTKVGRKREKRRKNAKKIAKQAHISQENSYICNEFGIKFLFWVGSGV